MTRQSVVVLQRHPRFYSHRQSVMALAVAQWLALWLDSGEDCEDAKRGPLYLLEPPDNLPSED